MDRTDGNSLAAVTEDPSETEEDVEMEAGKDEWGADGEGVVFTKTKDWAKKSESSGKNKVGKGRQRERLKEKDGRFQLHPAMAPNKVKSGFS